jgi:hypothetical protein
MDWMNRSAENKALRMSLTLAEANRAVDASLAKARELDPLQPFISSALIMLARGVVDLTKPTLRRE